MTAADVIAHWRKGSKEPFQLAGRAHDDGSYALALFHCHLAVEKALKALYVEQQDADPPYTHELPLIAGKIKHPLSEDQLSLLDALTNFSVGARYDDIEWSEQFATKEHSSHWLKETKNLLSALLP